MADALPWYHEGLPFECQQCGGCCTGAPGYVWVSKQEIEAMAARLGFQDVRQFERRYVRRVGIRKSLIEYANGDCVFFDPKKRGCKVYAVRPTQCRTWPFWDSNLRSEAAWAAMCRHCPGGGRGPIVPLDQIEQQRGQRRV